MIVCSSISNIRSREIVYDQAMDGERTETAGMPDPSAPGVGYARLRDAIRLDIVTGVFQSGVRLKIPELCRRYGVSSIPIREALQNLEGEGLVVMMPNRGATVRAVDATFLGEIYDIREAIDGFMARRFVELATADALAAVETAQAELEACEDAGDVLGRHNADRRFHRIILGTSNNSQAMLIIERQNNLINALRLNFGQSDARRRQVREEHHALIAAFREGDGEAAARIAARHARNARNDLIARLKAGTSPRS
jgi:DNA-binding GntR family transcriptional regulator